MTYQKFFFLSLALVAGLLMFANPYIAHAQINLQPSGIGLPDNLQRGNAQQRVGDIIVSIINIMLAFSAILAVGAIIWGAVTMIISVGNDSKVASAKKIIFWAVLGLLLAGLSFLIVRFVGQALGVITGP